MAKKRFNTADNPALSYLSGASMDELEQESAAAHEALSPDGAATFQEISGATGKAPEDIQAILDRIQERGITPEDAAQLKKLYEIGKEAQRRAVKPETKSKRLNLLLKPSVFQEISRIAKAKGTSTNDYINNVLEQEIERERETRRQEV